MTTPISDPAGAETVADEAPAPLAHQTPTAHAPTPPAAAQPAVRSPFAAITVRDYIVDVIALTILIISLFLPWRPGFAGSPVAATRIDVLLITIVSIISLGLTYIWRAGTLGTTWNYKKTQEVRLLANIPYFGMTVVYLVLELVSQQGIGSALAFGLAGALLAAQPRQSELGQVDQDRARDGRWLIAVLAVAGITIVTTVVQCIKFLVLTNGSHIEAGLLVTVIVLGLLTPVLFAVVALKVQQRNETWRLIGLGVGIAGVVLAFVALAAPAQVSASFYGGYLGLSVVFWMAFGAAASAPSVGRLMTEVPALEKWQAMLRTTMVIALAASAVLAVLAVVNLIRVVAGGHNTQTYYGTESMVPWVLALVFAIIAIVGAFVAKSAINGNTKQGQRLGSAYAGLLFVLFLVLVIVGASASGWSLGGLAVTLAFLLPAALVALLWGPASVRSHYGSLPSAGDGHGGFSFDGASHGAAVPVASVPDAAPVAEAAVIDVATATDAAGTVPEQADALLAEAANPATAPARLHEMAVAYPHTHATIAANPSVYPGLSVWLASQAAVAPVGQPAEVVAEPAPQAQEPLEVVVAEAVTQVAPLADATVALDPLAAEAANPATVPARLHELAATSPHVHAAIAANPAAYPQLLEWLASVNSPGVAEALQNR